MASKSYENGKKGERIVASFLKKHRYWVHITKRSADGSQPVDIFAARENKPVLLDAKYVAESRHGYFSFEDVQSNQETSMRYAHEFAGIAIVGFAIVFEEEEDKIRYLYYEDYMRIRYECGRGGINKKDLLSLEVFVI